MNLGIVIEANNICITRKKSILHAPQTILHNISLCVHENDCVAILGNNGVGKSTLLKILAGFIKPTAGTLKKNYSRLGYVPEEPMLPPLFTPYQLIYYYARFSNQSLQNIEPLLEHFDLIQYMHQRICTLSKGTRQRLSIARALISNPEILILDEPFSGLDQPSTTMLLNACFESSKKTIIYATHEKIVSKTNQVYQICNQSY